jgi:hypothetical protein
VRFIIHQAMKRLLPGVACAFIVASSALAAERTPADLVADIYRIAGGPLGDYQTKGIDEKGVRQQFSRSLLKAMDAMNQRSKKTNEPILDFDPITDSQDPSVVDLKIAPDPGDPARPIIDASFDRGDNARDIVRYVFVREGNAWKLDDISGGADDSKWDLREIITSK